MELPFLPKMWTLRLVIEYLSFLLKAKSPSAVHSPYLFDLMPHAFDHTKAYYAFGDIERARHTLRQSEAPIDAPDHGAGSRRKYKRTVGDFVAAALSSPRQCEILFRLAVHHKPQVTVELGAAVGISTAYLSRAAPGSTVYTFEANPLFVELAESLLTEHRIDNVELVKGNFDDTLEATLKEIAPVDLAFIDGNHKLLPTVAYFNTICNYASDRAIIIIDDIRWSSEMLHAWQQISADPRAHVAIDAFSFGMIFLGSRFKDKEKHCIAPSVLNGGPILG